MDVISWLMDSDPAIRWQVTRDLSDAPPKAVTAERARVAGHGWGARLLALQADDGQWGGGLYSPKWISTTYTLLLLRHLGVDPKSSPVQAARDRLVEGGVVWRGGSLGSSGSGFFEYLGETCVTGMNLALGCYFGAGETNTARVVEWSLDEQLDDGGWNCESHNGSVRSSFHTTISMLEALLEYERSGRAPRLAAQSAAARARAHAYLLDRHLHRSLTTGESISPSWNRFSFPPRWWFDVLRGLDYLRDAEVAVDDRWGEALELLERKRTKDGRWKLQNHHSGREHFRMENPGEPSRWNTLRALRVQRWVASSQ